MSKKRNIPPAVRRNQGIRQPQDQSVTIQGRQYSGPIPSPEDLGGFEQIIPGAAERILTMAEENGKHQRDMEKEVLSFSFRTVQMGQIFGLIIGILAFVTCIVALYLGSENTAMTIGGVTITGLVAVFVTGRMKKPSNSKSITN